MLLMCIFTACRLGSRRMAELFMLLFTGEKAIKKKQICVKLVPRNTTETAVIDLILLSRSKRAPVEYILTGYVRVYFHLSRCKPISGLPFVDEFYYCMQTQHCCSTFNYIFLTLEGLIVNCIADCPSVSPMPALNNLEILEFDSCGTT